ncbi:MAG: hypothetical protein NZ519_06195 [Bacteroidia bacterium]|nr:hypothetical protein [Bacteroidia bacterium]MDW8302005.1 hypothetical protein [Bacteroidia bacterium]
MNEIRTFQELNVYLLGFKRYFLLIFVLDVSFALMPTRSACCGLRTECPDPCVIKGHAQKNNLSNLNLLCKQI